MFIFASKIKEFKEDKEMLNQFMVCMVVLMLPFGNVTDNGGNNVVIHDCQAPAIYCQYMDTYLDNVYDPYDIPTRTEGAMELMAEYYPDWEASYQFNEFDCSEMSAYLSYYLKACGIPNTIIAGETASGEGHTWIEVPVKTAYGTSKIIVESTTFEVLNPSDPIVNAYYSKYKKYDLKKLKSTELDWWNSKYFLNKYLDLRTDFTYMNFMDETE
ncbi:MAG: hypothetical protein E7222_07715 [Clostridiales bacterium]|nr:hypothetical protein [Clostridiales bacterium]